MNISEISNLIWENSVEIPFGVTVAWDLDTFKKGWFTSNDLLSLYESRSPGWYWFSCNIPYQQLHDTQRPTALPQTGCDFGLTSHENIETFGERNLCVNDGDNAVIYNGHEGNVMSRLRTHFSLNNGRTGALGIKHYHLSNQNWKANIFTASLIQMLPQEIQARVQRLINNKTGRCAVESAWRTNNGWPILCKQ